MDKVARPTATGDLDGLSSRKTVLVVDDEPDIVDLMLMVLEDDDLSLLTAYDGREALEVVREQHPDLVLTDVMMPYLDGRDLCRAIRSDASTRDIPVVLMSAAQSVDPHECGADNWIPKPFDLRSVIYMIKYLLGSQKPARDQLALDPSFMAS